MPATDITFRDMERSPALENTIQEWVSRLEKLDPRLLRCSVVIAKPHRHQRHGAAIHVTIEIAIPDQVIVIGREPELDDAHSDAHVAVADAFRSARRRLQSALEIRRGDVKAHA
ncbi:MAG TPA: HPF/RaiA family ribosome-associated protein [Kofleriaceae bacterium]|jgi:ribosome-associated translation inhibitor RaiA